MTGGFVVVAWPEDRLHGKTARATMEDLLGSSSRRCVA
jgi:hypothetical protein